MIFILKTIIGIIGLIAAIALLDNLKKPLDWKVRKAQQENSKSEELTESKEVEEPEKVQPQLRQSTWSTNYNWKFNWDDDDDDKYDADDDDEDDDDDDDDWDEYENDDWGDDDDDDYDEYDRSKKTARKKKELEDDLWSMHITSQTLGIDDYSGLNGFDIFNNEKDE